MTCAIKGGKRTRKQRGSRRSGGKKQQNGGGLFDWLTGKTPEQAPTSVENPLVKETTEGQDPTGQSQVVEKPTADSSSTSSSQSTKPAEPAVQPPKKSWWKIWGGKRKTHKKSRKH